MPKEMTELDKAKLQKVLNTFNFEKMRKVMEHLEWVWVEGIGRPFGVPNIDDLRKTAKQLLEESFEERESISSGGFSAEYDGDNFFLSFVVTDSDSFMEEEEVEEIELISKQSKVNDAISSLEVTENSP